MIWLSEPSSNIPEELQRACQLSTNRLSSNRYRSRTEVTDQLIATAFSWMRLPTLKDGELQTTWRNWLRYITKPIQRGTPTEEAVEHVKDAIARCVESDHYYTVLTFNTATAAIPSEAVKEMLTNDTENYTELNVRTMLTSTPNHKIHVYQRNGLENQKLYIVLNNLDTPTVIFKLAAALMLIDKPFEDATEKFAQEWMTGDANRIYEVVREYYKEYNAGREERLFNETLTSLVQRVANTKKQFYDRSITEKQGEINRYYEYIAEAMQQINKLKGEYLLQMTLDEDTKIKDLQDYLKTCRDKISHIEVYDSTLTIIYHTALMYFEETLLEPYFKSTRGNIINGAEAWLQQLIKDVFLNKKYTLNIESGIQINLDTHTFRYVRPTQYGIYSHNAKGIPNPHHEYYNCWGDNQPIIHQALNNSDFLTAILTAFAAMAGINLSDTAVIEKFVTRELYDYRDYRCLLNNESGELITIKEYERRFNDASSETDEQTDTGSDNGNA